MTNKPKLLGIGCTGSLGRTLLAEFNQEYDITVFSRDETKHSLINKMFPMVNGIIGDVRDRDAVCSAIIKTRPNVVINAAALKIVPLAEVVVSEVVKTTISGTENVAYCLMQYAGMTNTEIPIRSVNISTDKSTQAVNVYGAAKFIAERAHLRYNSSSVVSTVVKYGNVLESANSLIPLIKKRFSEGLDITITHPEMTRFFLTLPASAQLIRRALQDKEGGKIFIPKIKSARIVDVVELFRNYYQLPESHVKIGKVRPGEKMHECLISQEELYRTEDVGDVYQIHDILRTDLDLHDRSTPLTSGDADILMGRDELTQFLTANGIL